jgi:hypothetical protein
MLEQGRDERGRKNSGMVAEVILKVFEGVDEGTQKYLKLPLLSYQECGNLFK